MVCYKTGGCGVYENRSCYECPASRPEYVNRGNMICNRSENLNVLVPYVGKPVYIKGYCWNRSFDGWVVLYDTGPSWVSDITLMFDYKGHSYSVLGFLPSRFTSQLDSAYSNAIYKNQPADKSKE